MNYTTNRLSRKGKKKIKWEAQFHWATIHLLIKPNATFPLVPDSA